MTERDMLLTAIESLTRMGKTPTNDSEYSKGVAYGYLSAAEHITWLLSTFSTEG